MNDFARLIGLARSLGYSVAFLDRPLNYICRNGRPAYAQTDYRAKKITISDIGSTDACLARLRHELTHALGEPLVPRSTEEIRLGQVCGEGQPWWWWREAYLRDPTGDAGLAP